MSKHQANKAGSGSRAAAKKEKAETKVIEPIFVNNVPEGDKKGQSTRPKIIIIIS
jgi:hypothetical protein